MVKFIRRILRLARISYVMSRNLALFPLQTMKISPGLIFILRHIPAKGNNISKGERLASAFEQLGPFFIKFGQTLSTRADIVGADIAMGLSRLQDRLPPFSSSKAIKIIEEELGGKITDFYAEFDETPVAAASIAQVHKATTLDGRKVAVKVLRPNIEKLFKRDLDLFYWLAEIIEKKSPTIKLLKPKKIVNLFAESVALEMDLRFEAASASELKENNQEDFVYIPEIDWNLTSRRVLTLEWVDAVSVDNVEELKRLGHNLKRISEIIAITFFNQAYQDGFFHADLHPGNMLINQKGQLVLIDFGIMGRLDEKTRIFMAEILRGFLNRDYLHIAKIHYSAGFITDESAIYKFACACRAIGEPIVGMPASKISIGKLLAHLFEVVNQFQMQTKPQLTLLQRTIMQVEGVGMKLNPEVNMWKLAEPWIERWTIKNIGPEAKVKNTVRALYRHFVDTINQDKSDVIVAKEQEIVYVQQKVSYLRIFFMMLLMQIALFLVIGLIY